jgi:hypothetical protein
LHRPGVVFVTERAENSLPQGLFPAGLPRPRGNLRGLGLETDLRRLPQEFRQFFRREFAQRSGALAAQIFRQRFRRLGVKPQAKFGDGCIEKLAQGQRGGSGAGGRRNGKRGFGSVPNDVQDHLPERGIAVVAVGVPAAGLQIHFHVAGVRRGVAELDNGAAKIRAAFATQKTRMKNPHGLAVQGSQLLAEQALVLPDGLEQALGRNPAVFAQDADAAAAQPPSGIETGRIAGHLPLLLRGRFGNVKPCLRFGARDSFRAPADWNSRTRLSALQKKL